MRHSRLLGVALSFAAAVALLGGMPSTVRAASQVPFKATFTAVDTLVTQNCPSFCFANTGAGTATHLGSFTSTGLIVGTSVAFPSPGLLETTTTETYVLTAANGDTVDLMNIATGVEDLMTGAVTLTGNWSITGGTGRFSGASGAGTTSGTAQLSNGTTLSGVATLVGTISSPGSLS